MSQYLGMSFAMAKYMALIGITVTVLLLLTALLVDSFQNKKWTEYAKQIATPNLTGNSLELLRAVCRHHRLMVQEIFCCNHRTGELSLVTELRSGDIFYQFELFNSKKVTLGEIYNGCIFVHSRESWYQRTLFRHRFDMAFNKNVDAHLSTP